MAALMEEKECDIIKCTENKTVTLIKKINHL